MFAGGLVVGLRINPSTFPLFDTCRPGQKAPLSHQKISSLPRIEKFQKCADDVDVDVVIDANLSGFGLFHPTVEHRGKDWSPCRREDETVGSKGLITDEELDVSELFGDS